MTIEAGVLVGKNNEPIFWHLPFNRTGGALPDSRKLWDVLWENRQDLLGFAHSHPGSGVPGPSYTDVTTFSAIELALGRRLDWWITSSDHIVVVRFSGPQPYSYHPGIQLDRDPPWLAELRHHSGYGAEKPNSDVEGRSAP